MLNISMHLLITYRPWHLTLYSILNTVWWFTAGWQVNFWCHSLHLTSLFFDWKLTTHVATKHDAKLNIHNMYWFWCWLLVNSVTIISSICISFMKTVNNAYNYCTEPKIRLPNYMCLLKKKTIFTFEKIEQRNILDFLHDKVFKQSRNKWLQSIQLWLHYFCKQFTVSYEHSFASPQTILYCIINAFTAAYL